MKTKVETRERRWSLQGKGRAGAIRGVARQLCRHARGKRLAARTRLTQKALGLLHDAPGEQAGVGHVWGEGVESELRSRTGVGSARRSARGTAMGREGSAAPLPLLNLRRASEVVLAVNWPRPRSGADAQEATGWRPLSSLSFVHFSLFHALPPLSPPLSSLFFLPLSFFPSLLSSPFPPLSPSC